MKDIVKQEMDLFIQEGLNNDPIIAAEKLLEQEIKQSSPRSTNSGEDKLDDKNWNQVKPRADLNKIQNLGIGIGVSSA